MCVRDRGEVGGMGSEGVPTDELSLGNEFGSGPGAYWSVVSKANAIF